MLKRVLLLVVLFWLLQLLLRLLAVVLLLVLHQIVVGLCEIGRLKLKLLRHHLLLLLLLLLDGQHDMARNRTRRMLLRCILFLNICIRFYAAIHFCRCKLEQTISRSFVWVDLYAKKSEAD